jgi:hypothetical protein
MTPHEAALEYRATGSWSPVAVIKDREGKWKRPAISGWDRFSHELPTIEEIDHQFKTSGHTSQVGIVCGEASGIFVIDLDGQEGINNFKLLCPNGIPPITVMSRTGGGGIHMFFSLPDSEDFGFEITNSVGRIDKGIDVRASRGFVVVPPSDHHSGKNYEWLMRPWWLSGKGQEADTIFPPDWLMEKLKSVYGSDGEPKVRKGVGEAISEGQRNNVLASMAGAMRRVGMSQSAIYAGLDAENINSCEPPLSDGEIRTIAKSVSRYVPAARGGIKI